MPNKLLEVTVFTPIGNQVVAMNPEEWKRAIDSLKPGQTLRSTIREGKTIHPKLMPIQSILGRIWAQFKQDKVPKNTSACLKLILEDPIVSSSQLHTALHLLRSLDSDPELHKTFKKKQLQDYRHALVPFLIPFLLEKVEYREKMKEMQSLWVLSHGDTHLKKLLKLSPQYALVKTNMINVEHALEQWELHNKRIEKFEEIVADLHKLTKEANTYLKALQHLRELLPHLVPIDKEDCSHFDNILLSYTLATSQLSMFEESVNGKDLSLLSPQEFDERVGELAATYRQNFFHILPQLITILFYQPQITALLHKLRNNEELKYAWWDALSPEARKTFFPWSDTHFHVLKMFRPTAPFSSYLENYGKQLLQLQLLMPKHSPAWKKLNACRELLTL